MSIPFTLRDESHELVDADGSPIWPVHNKQALDDLGTLAGVFGGRVEEAASATPGQAGKTDELVVGIGDVDPVARLYGHLTHRRWSCVKTISDLPEPLPNVVIQMSAGPDPELLRMLWRRDPAEPPVGIVWGRDLEELKIQALTCAAAARLNGPVGTREVAISVEDDFEVRGTELGRILGGGAKEEAVRDSVAEGAGCLSLFVHGDGTSVFLPPQLVMCRRANPPRHEGLIGSPACVETGRCYLTKKSVEETLSRHAIPPGDLSARLLVLPTCYGVFVGSRAVDSRWALLGELTRNPKVGAVLATPEPSTISPAVVFHNLSRPLATGSSATAAMTAYHQSEAAREIGHRLFLFGDPRTRSGPPPSVPVLRQEFTRNRSASTNIDQTISRIDAELRLLRGIASSVRQDIGEQAVTTSASAIAELDRVKESPADGRNATALRLAVLEHLKHLKARTYASWIGGTRLVRRIVEQPCPSCSWPIRAFDGDQSGQKRSFLCCPRCGVVGDLAEGCSIQAKIEPPVFELVGQRPKHDWDAAAFIVPSFAEEATIHHWPKNDDGSPASHLEIPREDWPPGPIVAQVVILEGLTMSASGCIVQAPKPL